jgi:hypothetical protein
MILMILVFTVHLLWARHNHSLWITKKESVCFSKDYCFSKVFVIIMYDCQEIHIKVFVQWSRVQTDRSINDGYYEVTSEF